jgi:hypothetical protein
MMREDWRRVGEALLVGRKANRSDKLFGQWCKANGFDDMHRNVRGDAMWLADNWSTAQDLCSNDACHPTHIRAAFNELQAQPSTKDDAAPEGADEPLPWEDGEDEVEPQPSAEGGCGGCASGCQKCTSTSPTHCYSLFF